MQNSGFSDNEIRTILVDDRLDVWIGTRRGGLCVLKGTIDYVVPAEKQVQKMLKLPQLFCFGKRIRTLPDLNGYIFKIQS